MLASAPGILLASLLGSVHCAGMCGGFVCFYTGSANPSDAAAIRAHGMYNVGRLTSYLLLGALAGALGAGVSSLGALAGVQHAATYAAGLLMVAWALSTLAAQRGVALPLPRAPLAWQRAMGRVIRAMHAQPIGVRAWITGLVTTMLPCGWLYVFVAAAGGTGSVASGIITMAVFWLGTVPAMLAVGIGAQRLLAPWRTRLPALSASVVLVLGLLSLSGHLAMPTMRGTAAHAGHEVPSDSIHRTAQ